MVGFRRNCIENPLTVFGGALQSPGQLPNCCRNGKEVIPANIFSTFIRLSGGRTLCRSGNSPDRRKSESPERPL